jgi:serine/threonine protein kinase
VGTPDYIAPEVLRKVGYGPEADLWGVGCVLFEMLCGFPPFFSDDAHTTCRKIVQWRSCFKFPSDVAVEPQAQSLIRQLLCDGADRLTIAACKVKLRYIAYNPDFAALFAAANSPAGAPIPRRHPVGRRAHAAAAVRTGYAMLMSFSTFLLCFIIFGAPLFSFVFLSPASETISQS